ncbi:MAG: hypothetical protein KDK39_18190 [Leptospiraceae bacterium]|nr:hypothetical protein [Leptospiraceae bacterium]
MPAKQQLFIAPGHFSQHFDVDLFGMDDGYDPDPQAAFRLIFQLGAGYMIYLYVVQMSRPADRHFYHSFWVKDCAVAEVEMEEFGPPDQVIGGPLELPLVYTRLQILTGARAVDYEIQRITFDARLESEQLRLTAVWYLDGHARLLWQNQQGWWLESDTADTLCLPMGSQLYFQI